MSVFVPFLEMTTFDDDLRYKLGITFESDHKIDMKIISPLTLGISTLMTDQ